MTDTCRFKLIKDQLSVISCYLKQHNCYKSGIHDKILWIYVPELPEEWRKYGFCGHNYIDLKLVMWCWNQGIFVFQNYSDNFAHAWSVS